MPSPGISQARHLAEILLLALLYAAGGWLVRQLWVNESPYFYASAVWPSAGIALGVLLVRGRRLWPGVWLGGFLTEVFPLQFTLAPETNLLVASLIATGITAQAVLGHTLVQRFMAGKLELDTAPAVLRFFLLCGPLASLVSTSVGNLTLHLLGHKALGISLIHWLTWWSGDTIGVLLVTPIVLAIAGTPQSIWRPRRLTVALPQLFALSVAALAFVVVSRLEENNRDAEFRHDANLIANEIQAAFSDAQNVSSTLNDFRRSNPTMTRWNFSLFAGALHSRHPAIAALVWAPRIGHRRLAAHEDVMREEGFPLYKIYEAIPAGRMPATGRAEYFPVQYIYPRAGFASVQGYDLASEETRRQALERARLTKQTAVSARLRLINQPDNQPATLVITPYFDSFPHAGEDGLVGYTLAVIRIDRLFEAVVQSFQRLGLDYRLEDLDAPAHERLLYANDAPHAKPIFEHVIDIRFGDRNWRLSIFARPDYAFAHRAWYAWATLASGVLASALLTFFLLVLSGRTLRTEQLVRERTAELEAAHAAAERTTQLLREAVSSIAQGFTIYDENDRLVICNEAYRRIYATSADLIVPGNSFEEIVRSGAERGQYKAALGHVDEWVKARVAQHQNADGRVIEQRLDDGRWLLIVEHRTPSGYIVGNRIDITELKQTAAALEDRNAQLDAILQLSPDGLVSFGASGRVKSANPAFMQMTGLSEAEIHGLSQQALETRLRARAENPEQWPGLDACFAKVGAGRTAPDQPERQLLALRSPRESVIELLGVNSDAPSVSRLLYLRDVTHEVEVDRMKSEFLSHAAHELRTPMASIYGFTELLVAQEFDAETRKDLLQTIHKQTAWLIEIINELLDISRIESRRGKDFRIEAVAVAPLVGEVLSALQIDQARWPVILDLPATLPAVMADAAKLRQIFTNVLGNAVKYSPDGGAIAIQGVLDTSSEKTFVGIAVADHGIGMTPAQAGRVCERFYRADTSGNIPGTGLGMAIVKEVIELLGGKIHVASAIGTGTSVTLWLPAASSVTISSTKGSTT
jgi:signal transduction histidine kinase/CHASE1-domain containing sensor protein